MLTILASSFAYDLQRIRDTILAPDLFFLFVYLFVDRKTLTALFQSLTYYSTSLLSLLQTVVLYLTQYSLTTHMTSTHYLKITLPTLLLMFLLLLSQNILSWTTYHRLLESYLSQLLVVTSWESILLSISTAFPVLHSTLTFPQVFLLYSSFSDTCCILPYIVQHLLLLLATNNFLLPTLSFSTFLYILLLVHHSATELSLLLILYLLAYILFFLPTPVFLLSAIPLLITP